VTARRDFGSIRRLPSGRWQATYWHEGKRHTGDHMFPTRADAAAWLSTVEADILRGGWVDPTAGKATLAEYANTWLEGRPDLRPSTRLKYRQLLDRYILPALGSTPVARLKPSAVRGWWAALAGEHPSTAAGAYRLLSTICRTAVADQVIMRSPCQVKGGGVERAAERPIATIAEVAAAVEATEPRWRLAVLLAVWCQLRRGEVLGLQRRDVDLLHGDLSVQRSVVVHNGKRTVGPPKTDAGVRPVAVPPNVIDAVTAHIDAHVGADADAWLFPCDDGMPAGVKMLERAWQRARAAVSRPDLHFHDLRHTGLTWSAATGASTAELMRRAGHASPTAALRYQHASAERDRVLANALAALAGGSVTPISGASRTQRACRGVGG
jgi:integrase